jgi:hypothetical protein
MKLRRRTNWEFNFEVEWFSELACQRNTDHLLEGLATFEIRILGRDGFLRPPSALEQSRQHLKVECGANRFELPCDVEALAFEDGRAVSLDSGMSVG